MTGNKESLPSSWLVTTLGELCEPSQYGYTARAEASGNYKFLRTTDITKQNLTWTQVPYCNINEDEAQKYQLRDGDIVISRAGSVGFSKLIKQPEKSVFASYLIRFRPLINQKFISFFLQSPEYWEVISERSSGIAVQNVNAKMLSNISVPVAPEIEQIRIVEKLEELFSDLDDGVTELKAAQIKLSQYRQSLLKSAVEGSLTAEWREQNTPKETGEQLLQRILKERREHWEKEKLVEFESKGKKPPKDWQKKYPEPIQPDTTDLPDLPEGWCWTTLSCLTQFIQTGPFGSLLHKHDYIRGGVPLVNPSHIRNQKIIPNVELTVSSEKLKSLTNFVMKVGDIIIGRRGEMGRCAVVTETEDGWLCGTGSLFLRLLDSVCPPYVSWILSSRRVKDYLSEFSVGTTMQNLNQKILRSVPIPFCPYEEQNIITESLLREHENTQMRETEISKGLEVIDVQRKNILKAAFSGRLVPQNPEDEAASELLEKIRTERVNKKKELQVSKGKKKVDMKKTDQDVIIDWVLQQTGSFNFEQLSSELDMQYEPLKSKIFELLDEDNPIISQEFNTNQGKMIFKVAKQ